MATKQTLYDCKAIANLIDRYHQWGGEYHTIEDGTLGYGRLILFGDGLKTTIVQEVALNCWSSAHTVRMYNTCPKRYEKYLED